MTGILFDESHRELRCSQDLAADRVLDAWTRQRQHLEYLGFDAATSHIDEHKTHLNTSRKGLDVRTTGNQVGT